MNIEILAAADFYIFFCVTESILRDENGCDLLDLESAIGRISSGPYNRQASHNSSNNLTITYVMKILKIFWEIEATGNDGETYIMDQFVKGTKFTGEHYVPLPDHEYLPDNYRASIMPFDGVDKSIGREPEII